MKSILNFIEKCLSLFSIWTKSALTVFMTITWWYTGYKSVQRKQNQYLPLKRRRSPVGPSYLVAPFETFLSSNWIRFSGNRSSYFIEMKSQVARSVINPVISHNGSRMAVMRFAERRVFQMKCLFTEADLRAKRTGPLWMASWSA